MPLLFPVTGSFLATCLWFFLADSSLNLIPAFAYPDTLFDNLNITAYKGQGKTDLKMWTGCLWTSTGALQVEGTVGTTG